MLYVLLVDLIGVGIRDLSHRWTNELSMEDVFDLVNEIAWSCVGKFIERGGLPVLRSVVHCAVIDVGCGVEICRDQLLLNREQLSIACCDIVGHTCLGARIICIRY